MTESEEEDQIVTVVEQKWRHEDVLKKSPRTYGRIASHIAESIGSISPYVIYHKDFCSF